ncbi:antibiotic biosynthesis monooxygenase [Nocardioides sp. KIGAM211]|uniref:Antibiotic biosynthesis monooxygenase n=1 Tax=Nocardioides luti TaxID=2761101 RepID=A0A7X0VAR6_9ACTN|nr:putative quinol monooxygenase [Nocardioides luti]MBB6627881.1 antibiotic biosynthesis monooxygenase [Nocardioides luti]
MTDLPTDAVRVVATIPTKPEATEAVRGALRELAAASLRDEEGCLAYDVFESQAKPGVFVTIEAWRGKDDLDAHMGTPHVASAIGILGDGLDGNLDIHPLAPL